MKLSMNFEFVLIMSNNYSTVVYGGNIIRFSPFKALFDAFEVQFFSGLHFYTLPKTLIPFRTMQPRFFKVKNC